MKYTARAKEDEVEVTKALEVDASGAGRIGYRVSSARATPVTICVVDRIPALADVQVPATGHGRWTITESTIECQLSIEPDGRAPTVVRFHTDDPRAVADARRSPQLSVDARAQRPADQDATEPPVDPPRDVGQSAPARGADDRSDDPTYPIWIDREGEFSMPDDEYTEADLIATGANPSADE